MATAIHRHGLMERSCCAPKAHTTRSSRESRFNVPWKALQRAGQRSGAHRRLNSSLLERASTRSTTWSNLHASLRPFCAVLDLNNRFHRLMLELTHCRTLRLYVEDDPATIFSLLKVQRILSSDPARLHALLIIEQDQHHRIIEAIEAGMGARAEILVREHASMGRRHLIELS